MSSKDTDLGALAKTLNTLPDDIQAELILGLRDIGEQAAAIAQMFVRVDTGALRETIHVEQTGQDIQVVAGGPKAPHAPIIEVKYPYLAPAIEAVKPQIDALIARIQAEAQERVSNPNK
jgi:hypothetical protein